MVLEVLVSVSHFAATTPAIVGICLGATLFLVGIVAVTLFFYRRKSFVRRKSGVYLTRRSPMSEQIPLQSQLIITQRAELAGKSPHLMMKKSPSPPLHFTSPSPKNSPITPPTEDGESGHSRRFSNTSSTGREYTNVNTASCIVNPTMAYAELHGMKTQNLRSRSPATMSHNYGTTATTSTSASHLVQIHPPGKRAESKSPKTSPQISPSSSSNLEHHEVMNQRNGNPNSTDSSPTTTTTINPDLTCSTVTTLSEVTSATTSATTAGPSVVVSQILTGGGQNALGILHFRIRYKDEKGALIVTVLKCEDLPVKDTTLMTCDPYVKLQLLPEKQQRVKTRVLRHTRQPIYDEDFTFYGIQPNQLQAITLHFVVLSFDRYSRDDVIGEVFCPLSALELPETDNHQLDISRDIQSRNLKMRSQGRGEVLVSLCWQPTANRLTVVVLKARNLPKMDVTGLADPYVKMYLLYDGQRIAKKKTHIKKRTLNPVFNESFVFDLPPAAGQANHLEKVSLQLLLLDWDRVTKNEVIGRLELGNGATSGTATHHWNEVLNCPRRQIAEWHKLRD